MNVNPGDVMFLLTERTMNDRMGVKPHGLWFTMQEAAAEGRRLARKYVTSHPTTVLYPTETSDGAVIYALMSDGSRILHVAFGAEPHDVRQGSVVDALAAVAR